MRGRQGPLQTKAVETMRSVLGDDFLTLSFDEYKLEASRNGPSHITCTVIEGVGPDERESRRYVVQGDGVGLVDAVFQAVTARYSDEHPSLETIRFSGFSIRALTGQPSLKTAETDAKAEATVSITNSVGHEFEFTAISDSVSHSTIEGVLAAIEYFVNSERAYVRLYKALQHHRTTGRSELVMRYTELLGEMVRNTSYSTAVERLKDGG